MEETVGMTVAMNEILKDASRSGNALKSISVNLAGMKASAKDGTLSLNKTAMTLKEIAGIEVLDKQTGEIKDMYQVMEELYGKWGQLNKQQRAGLSEAIAGKTQQNAFQALMSNWKKARKLVDDYNNGLTIGSAQKENLAFLDSIHGKLNAIKENLKSVANSIISSEFAKGFLDVIEKITAKIADFAKTDFGKIAIPFTILTATLTPLIGLLAKLSGVGKLTSALTGIASTAGGVSATATAVGSIGASASGSTGLIGTLAGALGGVSACTAGLVAVGVAVAGIGIAVGDSTSALSYLQRELGLIGTAISGLCEMINGAFQLTFGTLWENVKGIGKGLVALFTGDWSSIDDIFMETMANVRTNVSEAMSDIGMSTTRGLKTMQNLTREELSGVTSIFENEFKNLPKLTREGVDETSKIFAEKISTMSGEQINVMRGMGGEIGSTLFHGIHECMGEMAMEGQFSKNLITLLQSGLLDSGEIEKLINTYNSQLEKCVKDSSSNFKQTGTDMFNQMKEGLTSGNWKDALSDISSDIDSWSNEMLDKQRSFGEEWATLLDGVTEDMSKNEMFQKMYDNIDEFIEEGKMEEFVDGLRKSQQEAHKIIGEMAEDIGEGAEKTKEELQSVYENLDVDTRVKLKMEFEGVEESQLANIHTILGQFSEGIQVKLKGEGFKEVLAESKDTADLLSKLKEPQLIELMMNTEFAGSLTPEELEIAIKRLPDETIVDILSQTKFLDDMTPEQLAMWLNELPEETRADVVSSLIEKGRRTPEQLAEALSTLPDKKIAELILEMKESGKYTPEKIQEIIEYLPPEVRTVVEALVEGYDTVEQFKEDIEKLPTDNKVNIEVTETNPGKAKEVKQEIIEVPNKKDAIVNVLFGDGSGLEKGKETENLPNSKDVTVNTPTGDTSGLDAVEEAEKKEDVDIKVNVKQGDTSFWDGLGAWLKSKAQQNEQTITIKAKVGEVDTSSTAKIKIDPIKIDAKTNAVDAQTITSFKADPITIEAKVGTVDTSALTNITPPTITITANVTGANLVTALKTSITSIQSKTVNVTANVVGANLVTTLKTSIASIQSKAVNVTVSAVGANSVTALNSAINSLQGKTVTVNVIAEGATGIAKLISSIAGVNAKQVTVVARVTGTNQVNALTSAINKVKSKSVKITASVSGTSAVNSLASAIANVRSKTVKVNVNRSITTTTQTVGASVSEASYTPSPTSLLTSDIVSASNGIAPLDIPVTASASASTGNLFDLKKMLPSLDFDVNMFKNLEEALKRIGNQLDFINEKSEASFGKEKINLLQQQIPLLREQQKIQESIAKNERNQNSELIKWLTNKGFTFDNLGNISNYSDKLLAMEQNVDSLKKKYDTLNDAEKKNESAVKSAQKAYDSANETLSKTKDYLEEYFTTNNEEVIEASKKWWEYENQISETTSTIRELMNLPLENKISAIVDEIDFLDSKINGLEGKDKIQYFEEQNKLYKQQQQLLHALAEQMRKQLVTLNPLSEEYAELQSEIKGLSAEWWDLQDSIADNKLEIFEEQNKSVRNEIQQITDEIDFLDSKINALEGNNKIQYLEEQNRLYKQQQKTLHTLAEQMRKQLKTLDPLSEEYADMQSEIKDLSTEWWKLEQASEEVCDLIREIVIQQQLFTSTNEIKALNQEYEQLSSTLDIINNKLEFAYGTDKLKLMNDSIEIMNKQLKIQSDVISSVNKQVGVYQGALEGFGFKFDDIGNIVNLTEQMELFRNSDNLEDVEKLIEKYIDSQDELRGIIKDYSDLENAIRDVYKEQLEVTKDIESEITKIIEKEADKRKKEIENYTESRIELLKEEQKAYLEMRDEQDYKKTTQNQLDEIEALRKQIEIAKRDTSLSGQKRLTELTKQLAEAEKELAEVTQDKIDKDYENNISSEIEKLEKEQDAILKSLEEQFSEVNISKMVANALATGVIEINGEVQTLQDALINSINDSVEGYSVMSDIIKNELVSNLNVALETMKQMANIGEVLGLQNYNALSSSAIELIGIPSYGGSGNTITVGDTHLVINGNVSEDVISDIEELINQKNNEMLNKITSSL